MNGLICDRFLKRFFGSRTHRHTANPDGEGLTLPENAAENPKEPDCATGEGSPVKEATLENNDTGETNQRTGPDNGPD